MVVIHPFVPFGYLKGTSEGQYQKYLAKDIYGFLRTNKEDIASVLSTGYDVSFFFETCTAEQAREIYIAIIEVIQEPQWTSKDVQDAVRSCVPYFQEASRDNETINYYVERIARTELNRILFYAKEQMAVEDGVADEYYFAWMGPLDRRTTPMCRFLQSGELTGEDSRGKPYDYEYLRDKLPEWKPEWRLDELKQACRDVHAVFHEAGIVGTEMISDWQMHINCRHSFRQVSRIPESELKPAEMNGYIMPDEAPQPEPVPPELPPLPTIPENTPQEPEPNPFTPVPASEPTEEPTYIDVPGLTVIEPEPEPEETYVSPSTPMDMEIEGDLDMSNVEFNGVNVLGDMTESDNVLIDELPTLERTFGLEWSIHGVPAYYMTPSTEFDDEPVFVFSTADEFSIGKWSRYIAEELQEGMSEYSLYYSLKAESDLTNEEIDYLIDHWENLLQVSIENNWI